MKFTEIDDIAWEFFKLDWTYNTIMKNKIFFVHHKNERLYNEYYDKAKQELRKQKLKRICLKLEIE